MGLVVKNETYKIIEQDKKTIRNVIHISDIHIRKNDRVDEYKYVFNQLIMKLNELKINDNDSVIVVTGDIMEDKGELTGTSVSLLKELFLGLSSIATTVCIIGNHDIDLTKKDLDSISPVIGNAFTTKYPVFVFLDDCIYEYNNILFGVTTMGAPNVTPCEKQDGKVTIGLYHGIVRGGKNDNNLDLSQIILQQNKKCHSVNDFKKYYDYTLLGDIHAHQYLDEEHKVLYAGSLIQHNYGENLFEHGFELIDIIEKNTFFHRIKNKYGLLTVVIDNEGKPNINFNEDYPENLGIKLFCHEKNKDLVDMVYNTFEAKQTKIIDRSDHFTYNGYMSDIKVGSNDVINLTDKPSIINLISEYMKTKENDKFKMDDPTKSRIMIKINDVLDEVELKTNNGCKCIKLESLEFNNLMIYKDGNKINFKKFNKVVGLNGTNNIGKSAIIDILIYAIYGNCIRGYKSDIVRLGETEYKTTVRLTVNGKKYSITRKGIQRKKKENGIKRLINDEQITLIEDEKNPVTNKKEADEIIKNKICPIEDLKRSSILFQHDTNSFVTLDDKEKKELLCKYVGIDIFNTMACKINTKMMSIVKQINSTKKKILEFDKYGNDVNKILITIKNELTKCNQQKDTLDTELMNLIDQKTKLEISKSEIEFKINKIKSDEHYNSKIIQGSIDDLKYFLEQKQQNYKLIENEIININNKLLMANELLNNFEKPENILKQFNDFKSKKINKYTIKMNNLYSKLVNCSNKNQSINQIKKNENKIIKKLKLQKTKIQKLEDEYKNINENITNASFDSNLETMYNEYKFKLLNKIQIDDVIKKLNNEQKKYIKMAKEFEDYEYDPKCKYCVNNCMTKQKQFIDSSLNSIKNDLDDQKLNLQLLNDYMIENADVVNKYDNMQKAIKDNHTNSIKLENLQLQINKEKFKLEMIEAEQLKINDDKQNLEHIKTNQLIEQKINQIKIKLDKLTNKSCIDYDSYISFRNMRDTYKDKLEMAKNVLFQTSINIKEIETQISIESKHSNIIKKQKDMLMELSNLEQLKNFNKKEISIKNNQIDELRNTIREKAKLYENLIIINDKVVTLKAEYDELNQYYSDYNIIANIFGNNGEGIIDGLISTTILPKLESIVNQIYKNVDGSQLSLSFNDGHFSILRKTSGTQMYMNGGFVKHFGNMVFRVALMQINNYIKPNFIIIDEALDSCAKENIHLVIKLMDQFKFYYDFAFIISHDLEIKSKYDHTIKIEHHGTYSKINV